MEDAPAKEPTTATASDTLSWLRSLPSFPPAEGWALAYALRGPASLDFSAQAADGGYRVSGKAPVIPGEYFLQGYVIRGEERHTVYNGTLTLAPDLSAQTGTYDGRSANKKILDAIDLAISGRASRTDLEYEVDFGGSRRRLKSIAVEDLVKVRGLYAQKVWRENNPGLLGQTVNVRFGGGY